MEIQCFTVGQFRVNTYLITDPHTKLSAIVDTGESKELVDTLLNLDPKPNICKILLTHSHLDHAGALPWLLEHWNVPTYLPRLDRPLFDCLPQQGNWFGMPTLNRECGRIDQMIDDGDEISLGSLKMKFISTPGHTPGQGCYYDAHDIIVGDTLFAGSIGRTDFPMSDRKLMNDSLRRLLQLPKHLRVHSGHGPVTTLGHELATNPFLRFLRDEQRLSDS